MKKQFTPIAMLCNKEQFEAIKPKLDRNGNEMFMIGKFKENTYLVLFDHGEITNGSEIIRENYIIHETWNERIFLEACGIEKEEHFEIKKETIIKYQMKDEFPEVFKKEEQNGWHKDNTEPKRLGFFIDDCLIYGFDTDGNYFINKKPCLDTDKTNDLRATNQEVFEALKNEAVKRRFKRIGCFYIKSNKLFSNASGQGGDILFNNGIWSKTKEEAEKLLNCKILD